MADAFDLLEMDPEQIKEVQEGQRVAPSDAKDAFDQVQPYEKDSVMKSWLRTLYQVPSGMMNVFTYPLEIFKWVGLADSLDPEEIARISTMSEKMGVPFDEEKYRQAVSNAEATFPTQANIEREIEEATGAPLQPRTGFQKGLKFGSAVATGTPGSLLQKTAAGVTAPVASEALQAAGVPEPLADIGAVGIGAGVSKLTPQSVKKTPVTKPSGLPEKKFEKVKDVRKVSPGKAEKILEGVEKDFRKISGEIEEISPISKVKKEVKLNPNFDKDLEKRFKNIQKLSEILPNKVSQTSIKKALLDSVKQRKIKGLSPSEYEKDLKKFTMGHAKDLKMAEREVGLNKLVEQFRKNNEARSAAYEPGKAYAFNRAKKDALGEYNDILTKKISESDPALGKMHVQANKKYSQRADLLAIEEYIDKVFPKTGNIDFKFSQKVLKDKNLALPFKRSLGDNFPKFEQLIEDLSSYQKSLKNIKVAEKAGMSDVVSSALPYVIHPTFGKAVTATKGLKKVSNFLRDISLDKNKHKLIPVWQEGVSAFNKGDFERAKALFSKLDKYKEED